MVYIDFINPYKFLWVILC